jgi:hypothetical protein
MRVFLLSLALFSVSGNWAGSIEVCADLPHTDDSTEEQSHLVALYRKVSPFLGVYPSFAKVLEFQSPQLCTSTQMDNALAYFDADKNRIVIDEALSPAMQVGVLLHELRHFWQYTRASCPSDTLAMKEFARTTFALEADASAISLLFAWDMKEAGDDSVWNALSSWSSQMDIAASFAKTMHTTGDAGLAATSAFYQWYDSPERVERYYLSACSDYLDRQDAAKLIPRYQMIDDGFFLNLCKLPDGGTYACSDPRGAK